MQLKIPSLILSAFVALAAPPSASIKSTLQGKYDAISVAFGHKDAQGLAKFFSPKYVLIGVSGHKLPLKELLADYKKQMSQLDDLSWSRTLQSVTIAGASATVTAQGRLKGFQTKKDGKHVFESVSVEKDTWTRLAGGWVMLKTQVISIDATYDKRRLNRI